MIGFLDALNRAEEELKRLDLAPARLRPSDACMFEAVLTCAQLNVKHMRAIVKSEIRRAAATTEP